MPLHLPPPPPQRVGGGESSSVGGDEEEELLPLPIPPMDSGEEAEEAQVVTKTKSTDVASPSRDSASVTNGTAPTKTRTTMLKRKRATRDEQDVAREERERKRQLTEIVEQLDGPVSRYLRNLAPVKEYARSPRGRRPAIYVTSDDTTAALSQTLSEVAKVRPVD